MKSVLLSITLAAALGSARPCMAQEQPATLPTDAPRLTLDPVTIRRALASEVNGPSPNLVRTTAAQQAAVANWASENRACEGCPKRRVWAAYVQTGIINAFYNLGNHLRGEETAKVTFKTWWTNLKYGFEWDDNPFTTNQFGHPYQGSNYYTGARANGLSYWESAAVAAFGSATWEYFGENNYASFNDLVNTTLGGIALGETFHRAAWMIRDTTATGKTRLWQEILATVIDPVGGANRFVSGDSSRVSEKPKQFAPATTNATLFAGALWQGRNSAAFSESAKGFLEMDLQYGEPLKGRSRDPFDAFTVNFRMGGGKGISDVRVRGRLLGQPISDDGRVHFAVAQSYDYIANEAYEFGRQGFDAAVSARRSLTSRIQAVLVGGAGVTALGAVDQVEKPTTLDEPVGDEPRNYDYGPGSTFAGGALFLWEADSSPISRTRATRSTWWTASIQSRAAAVPRGPDGPHSRPTGPGHHGRVLLSQDVFPGRYRASR